MPGANPGLFAAWLLGLEANAQPGGLVGLGEALVRVFLYVACVLDGECLASLTELQALGEELRHLVKTPVQSWPQRGVMRRLESYTSVQNCTYLNGE